MIPLALLFYLLIAVFGAFLYGFDLPDIPEPNLSTQTFVSDVPLLGVLVDATVGIVTFVIGVVEFVFTIVKNILLLDFPGMPAWLRLIVLVPLWGYLVWSIAELVRGTGDA